VAAVIQARKWLLFTFDREQRKLVFHRREARATGRRAGRTALADSAPTVAPRARASGSGHAGGRLGTHWFDTRACRKRIASYRSQGMFQPPALQDSLMQPGNAGFELGGIAFDPRRQLPSPIPSTCRRRALIPREQLQGQIDSGDYDDFDFSRQHARRTACGGRPLRRILAFPASSRPGVSSPRGHDARTIGGRSRSASRRSFRSILACRSRRPIVTPAAVFIAASFERRLRAFDTTVARWCGRSNCRGWSATPMTYAIGGRQ